MVGLQLQPHLPPSGTPVRHTQCECRSSFQDVTVSVMSCQHEAIKQTTPRVEKVQAGLRKKSKPVVNYYSANNQQQVQAGCRRSCAIPLCHCTDTGSSGKAHWMAFFLIPAQNNLRLSLHQPRCLQSSSRERFCRGELLSCCWKTWAFAESGR